MFIEIARSFRRLKTQRKQLISLQMVGCVDGWAIGQPFSVITSSFLGVELQELRKATEKALAMVRRGRRRAVNGYYVAERVQLKDGRTEIKLQLCRIRKNLSNKKAA